MKTAISLAQTQMNCDWSWNLIENQPKRLSLFLHFNSMELIDYITCSMIDFQILSCRLVYQKNAIFQAEFQNDADSPINPANGSKQPIESFTAILKRHLRSIQVSLDGDVTDSPLLEGIQELFLDAMNEIKSFYSFYFVFQFLHFLFTLIQLKRSIHFMKLIMNVLLC